MTSHEPEMNKLRHKANLYERLKSVTQNSFTPNGYSLWHLACYRMVFPCPAPPARFELPIKFFSKDFTSLRDFGSSASSDSKPDRDSIVDCVLQKLEPLMCREKGLRELYEAQRSTTQFRNPHLQPASVTVTFSHAPSGDCQERIHSSAIAPENRKSWSKCLSLVKFFVTSISGCANKEKKYSTVIRLQAYRSVTPSTAQNCTMTNGMPTRHPESSGDSTLERKALCQGPESRCSLKQGGMVCPSRLKNEKADLTLTTKESHAGKPQQIEGIRQNLSSLQNENSVSANLSSTHSTKGVELLSSKAASVEPIKKNRKIGFRSLHTRNTNTEEAKSKDVLLIPNSQISESNLIFKCSSTETALQSRGSTMHHLIFSRHPSPSELSTQYSTFLHSITCERFGDVAKTFSSNASRNLKFTSENPSANEDFPLHKKNSIQSETHVTKTPSHYAHIPNDISLKICEKSGILPTGLQRENSGTSTHVSNRSRNSISRKNIHSDAQKRVSKKAVHFREDAKEVPLIADHFVHPSPSSAIAALIDSVNKLLELQKTQLRASQTRIDSVPLQPSVSQIGSSSDHFSSFLTTSLQNVSSTFENIFQSSALEATLVELCKVRIINAELCQKLENLQNARATIKSYRSEIARLKSCMQRVQRDLMYEIVRDEIMREECESCATSSNVPNAEPNPVENNKEFEKIRRAALVYRRRLQCRACDGVHDISHVLRQCGHAFCKTCIESLLYLRRRNCPICLQKSIVTWDDVVRFYLA